MCRLAPTCCNIEHYINNIIVYEEISAFSGQVHLNLKKKTIHTVVMFRSRMVQCFFFFFKWLNQLFNDLFHSRINQLFEQILSSHWLKEWWGGRGSTINQQIEKMLGTCWEPKHCVHTVRITVMQTDNYCNSTA